MRKRRSHGSWCSRPALPVGIGGARRRWTDAVFPQHVLDGTVQMARSTWLTTTMISSAGSSDWLRQVVSLQSTHTPSAPPLQASNVAT
jgi:hypothetical protein